MTNTIKFNSVLTAITGISISGVTIADVDAVSDSYTVREAGGTTSVLYPLIGEGMVEFNAPVLASFGTGNGARKDLSYTLHYRLLYLPVGTERGLKEVYSGMFDTVANIINAFLQTDALADYAIDIVPRIASRESVVSDNSGNKYYGANIDFDVREFAET
jgi:hypothetical protein